MFARYLLPALLAFRAVPAAADTLTDLLPPDSKIVIGIRVRNLAVSSFAAQAQAAAAGWLKAVPLDGIDFLRDIDEVLIASPGKGSNPRAIVVVAGRFDVAGMAEGATRYHEVPLLTGENETDSAVAFLPDGAAVIGDPALVRAAIDQRGKARIDAALNDRITSLRQRYDVWGLGELPEGLATPIPEAQVLESIGRFQFGMQLASGLELDAELHSRSPQDAEKLNAALAAMAALLPRQESSTSTSKFDMRADGGTFKLAVSISEEELKKAIQAGTDTLATTSTQAAAPITAAELSDTGPNAAPEAAPAPAPATPQPVAKPAKPKAIEQDTVILTLPGKK